MCVVACVLKTNKQHGTPKQQFFLGVLPAACKAAFIVFHRINFYHIYIYIYIYDRNLYDEKFGY
jgi:hypothetical protein